MFNSIIGSTLEKILKYYNDVKAVNIGSKEMEVLFCYNFSNANPIVYVQDSSSKRYFKNSFKEYAGLARNAYAIFSLSTLSEMHYVLIDEKHNGIDYLVGYGIKKKSSEFSVTVYTQSGNVFRKIIDKEIYEKLKLNFD